MSADATHGQGADENDGFMRALIYARYSTTLQSSLSIDDQVRVCTEFATRNGWTVGETFFDAAISGAVRDRPGLNALLKAIGPDTIVTAESLDRISRDLEDMAALSKQIAYAGGTLWTISEGKVDIWHIGMRGTMAQAFRKDTADKVKRGMTGRALAGMCPGGLTYGYRKIAKFDSSGNPIRGLREIDPVEAEIIARVFRWTADGLSARTQATLLNRDGIPAPGGGRWSLCSILGDPKRHNGILRNPLYRGQLTFNRTHRVYHPITRKRLVRINPESEWTIVDVPELRIVADELWHSAHAQLRKYAGPLNTGLRRPKKLLSGKAVCGVCGSTWRIVGDANRFGGRWGCGAHKDGRGCTNGRTITNDSFERRVLQGLSERLLDPDLVAAYLDQWTKNRASRIAAERKERSQLERRKNDAEKRVQRLVAAVGDGLGDIEELGAALRSSKAELERVSAELTELGADNVFTIHPGLANQYRRRVANLIEALQEENSERTRDAVRGLIDRIVVMPKEGSMGTAIQVDGLLSGIVDLAGGESSSVRLRWCPWSDSNVSVHPLRVAC
jgi:site-specific DNA recombinase